MRGTRVLLREEVQEGEAEEEGEEGQFSFFFTHLEYILFGLVCSHSTLSFLISGFNRATRAPKPPKPKSDKLCIFFQKTGTFSPLYFPMTLAIEAPDPQLAQISQDNVNELTHVVTFTTRRRSRSVPSSSVRPVLERPLPVPSLTTQTHTDLLTVPISLPVHVQTVLTHTSSSVRMRKCVEISSNTVGVKQERLVTSDM